VETSVSEELSEWASASRIQGDPSKYSKTDVEIGAMRLFDGHKFSSGKSQREKRRSFEEVWESSNSNPEAVAYAFGAALKAKIYSMSYVKACARNFSAPPVKPEPFKFSMPKIKLDPPKVPMPSLRPPVELQAPVPVSGKAPKKKKVPKPSGPMAPDVEWS
jgi:hypothetical protein